MQSNLAVLESPTSQFAGESCEQVHFAGIAGNRFRALGAPAGGPGCAPDDGGLEQLTAPDASSDNQDIPCANACAGNFDLGVLAIQGRGLALTGAGCARTDLRVDTVATVPTDGTGALRRVPKTRAGSCDGCP